MTDKNLIIERRKVNEGLQQQMQDINDRLSKYEQLPAQMEKMSVELSKLTEEIRTAESARIEREKTNEDMKKVIYGEGSNPGLKTDVPILKRDVQRIFWLIGAVIGAMISYIVSTWS